MSAAPTPDLASLRIDRGDTTRRRRRSPWVGRVVWLALLLGALWLFQRPLRDFVERLRLPSVKVARAVGRDARAAGALAGTAANGFVVARVRAALSADTPGRIVELRVVEGSRVAAGEVVARLYSEEHEAVLRQSEADLELARAALERVRAEGAALEGVLARREADLLAARAQLAGARADLAFAQAEHARVEEMVAGGVESERVRDAAQRDLVAARADEEGALARVSAAEGDLAEMRKRLETAARAVQEAEALLPLKVAARELAAATLEKTFVRAPFDGVVVSKEAEVGEIVSPSSQGGSNARGSVATVVDLSTLEVQADVPETSLSAVRLGAPARVFLDAFPDRAYEGRVDRIWPMADRQRATVEVRVAFLEPDELLRPEMGVRVVFLDPGADAAPAAAEPVVRVPAAALVRRDGGTSLFVLEGDRARLRAVEVASSDGTRADLRAGVVDGEQVVLEPPPSLVDGTRVRAVP